MTTTAKRNKLLELIETMDAKKIEAIYTFFEENIEGQQRKYADHWQDKSFVAEMDHRYNEYINGHTKLLSLDEVEQKARRASKKLKAK